MADKEIRALIVGAGIIGQRHIKAQKSLGVETAVYDIAKDREKKTAETLRVSTFETFETAFEWATLVHICVPDDLHKDVALACIAKGKHIFCEKPLTTSLHDALILKEAASKQNVHFLIANNYRLTPSFLEIYKRVQKKKIGKLIAIKTTYLHDIRSVLKKTPWRAKQNFLYGGGIHAIDLAYWLASEKVVKVYANTGAKYIKAYESPEDYHVVITFASGMTAEVWVNARVVLPIHRSDIEVYGEKGSLFASNRSTSIKYFTYKQKEKHFLSKNIVKGWRYTVPREIEIVNKFILGKVQSHWPLPNLDEAVEVIRILDAAEKYLQTGEATPIAFGI